jgi:hypothetical protein
MNAYWVARVGEREVSVPCINGRKPHGLREERDALAAYLIELTGNAKQVFDHLLFDAGGAEGSWDTESRKIWFLHDVLDRMRRRMYMMHALSIFLMKMLRIWLAKSVVERGWEQKDTLAIYRRIHQEIDLLDENLYNDEGISEFYMEVVLSKIMNDKRFALIEAAPVISAEELQGAGYCRDDEQDAFRAKVDFIVRSELDALRKCDPSRSLERDLGELKSLCHTKGRKRNRREAIGESRNAWEEIARQRESVVIELAKEILESNPSLTRSSLADRIIRKMSDRRIDKMGKSTIQEKLKRAGLPSTKDRSK